MIEPCRALAIEALVDRITRFPSRYRAVVVSSPFIDEFGLRLLRRIDDARPHFRFDILTRFDTAATIGTSGWHRASVRGVPLLHAKLYAALGIVPAMHEAIVSSANLTAPGLRGNVELGIRVTGSAMNLTSLVERIVTWAHCAPRSRNCSEEHPAAIRSPASVCSDENQLPSPTQPRTSSAIQRRAHG